MIIVLYLKLIVMMKKLLSAMLLLPLIFINYYCNKTSPTDSEPPTRPEPPIQSDTATIINPNVRMIDSAILTLKNDTTLLNQGIYEFSFCVESSEYPKGLGLAPKVVRTQAPA